MHLGGCMSNNYVSSGLKGLAGEISFGAFLRDYCHSHHSYYLHNVVLPTTKAKTTQVDFVYLSTRGFFCFEVKNWSGEVFCSNSSYWKVEYSQGYVIPNPILQNAYHVEFLNRNTGAKFYNIVVFPNNLIIHDRVNGAWHFEDAVFAIQHLKVVYTEEYTKSIYNKLLKIKQYLELQHVAQMIVKRGDSNA
jgi:hypothetical protein